MYDFTEDEIRRFQSYCYFDENKVLRWGGGKDPDGYGQFCCRGKKIAAHRIAQDLWGDEPLKEGDHVLHDNRVVGKQNRDIIDVRYLYIGDHEKNMCDVREAGTNKGERNSNSKLTAEQALDIYKRAWAGHGVRGTIKALADEFGVATSTISEIKMGIRWSHVTGHVRDAA